MKNKNYMPVLITLAIIVAVAIIGFSITISTNNGAISLEESIGAADSGIKVQEKRRADLIGNLVDTAEQYAKHESSTLTDLAALRSSDSATAAFKAVAEAYPELKADAQYKQVMTELSLTENRIADYRENYNANVKLYNRHVRTFPGSFILPLMGYEIKSYDYKDYGASEDAPTNLYGNH